MLHAGTAGWWVLGVALALSACAHAGASRSRPAFGQQPAGLLGASDARGVTDESQPDRPRAVAPTADEFAVDAAAADPADVARADAIGAAVAPAQVVEAAAPAAVDDRVRERELRDAFARSEAGAEAALQLASFLSQRERVDEALYVVDQALEQARPPELRIARAGLLRDLADCRGAADELQRLLRELGPSGLAPGTMFELAQVEWLAGQREDARVTLRALQQHHGDDPWLREHRDALQELRASIEENKVQNAMGVRDMLAMLRRGPTVTARLRLLERIATPTGTEIDAERLPLRLRAIAISSDDDSPAVRCRALQLAAINGVVDPAYWRGALADEAELTRRMAAKACRRAMAGDAMEPLLARLAVEPDAAVAAVLHGELAALCDAPAPSSFDLASAEGRAAAVAHWQQRCP